MVDSGYRLCVVSGRKIFQLTTRYPQSTQTAQNFATLFIFAMLCQRDVSFEVAEN
jgi:hypothetical protein